MVPIRRHLTRFGANQIHIHGNRRALSLLSSAEAFEYLGSSMINPATLTAHLLESIHSLSGLSWPGAIVAFTICMRAVLFPAFIKQTKATITASNLKDQVAVYQTRIEALKAKNQISEARQELQEMYAFLKKNNAHPIRTIVLSLIPAPIFMASFFALRNMSNQPIPSFLEGGLAWFSNLTIPDPYYILPVLSTLTLMGSFEVNSFS
jgi:YidC/Oxa1 family membrane protein insertase